MRRRRTFNWAGVFGAPPPDRVYIERIETLGRRGQAGVRRRWVAEAKEGWHGTGRTRREAIRNMSNAYNMDFDSIAWKTRMSFA